jgi:site-specific DNA-cytosine methylase
MSETKPRKLNILVLFDGAGLAMRGLLDAGHECTGVELMPEKAHLSKLLNPDAKAHIVANVLDLDMEWVKSFDAVWASPPCQSRSKSNKGNKTQSAKVKRFVNDSLLKWSLKLPNKILWVENVIDSGSNNTWGNYWNAAQFLQSPIQNRQRVIGGRFVAPEHHRGYKPEYSHDGWHISPCVTASMWKRLKIVGELTSGIRSGTCEEFYGYAPTLDEAAYLQGLNAIPLEWYDPLGKTSWSKWQENLYEAIGNAVPVYMSRAFGEAYSKPKEAIIFKQLDLFEKAAAA